MSGLPAVVLIGDRFDGEDHVPYKTGGTYVPAGTQGGPGKLQLRDRLPSKSPTSSLEYLMDQVYAAHLFLFCRD